MNRKERKEIAKQIMRIEKRIKHNGEQSIDAQKIQELVSQCSIQDLISIDDYIMSKIIKKS